MNLKTVFEKDTSMADAQDIESPPYPTIITPPDGVYVMLDQLRDWVIGQRQYHNSLSLPREPPAKQIYSRLGVAIMFQHAAFMRHVRETWDDLIRTYEDAWDCAACMEKRKQLSEAVVSFLADAFLDNETREAKQATFAKKWKRFMEKQERFINRMLDEEDNEQDEDWETSGD